MALNISFNQSGSHLICCGNKGETIYKLMPSLSMKIDNNRNGGVGIFRMFGTTNIMIFTGGGKNPCKSKDTVVIWDECKKKIVTELDMKETVRNICVANDRIVVVLEKMIYIFNFKGVLLNTKPTYSNPDGLCVINNNADKFAIVSLGLKKGEVMIWEPINDKQKLIQAHNSNIEYISTNNTGNLIATASETGTLIRVFAGSEVKYEFRRGTYTTRIFDLQFSKDSKILACCSGNGTIHLFDLYDNLDKSKNTQSYLSSIKSYLPTYFSSQWGFAQISLPNVAKATCVFDDDNILHVATYDMKYYRIIGPEYAIVTETNIPIN